MKYLSRVKILYPCYIYSFFLESSADSPPFLEKWAIPTMGGWAMWTTTIPCHLLTTTRRPQPPTPMAGELATWWWWWVPWERQPRPFPTHLGSRNHSILGPEGCYLKVSLPMRKTKTKASDLPKIMWQVNYKATPEPRFPGSILLYSLHSKLTLFWVKLWSWCFM